MPEHLRTRVVRSGAAFTIAAVVLTVSALVMPTRGLAASVTWTGAAGTGNWSTPGNWSTGSVPTASDDVIFPLPTGSSVMRDDITWFLSWHSATFVGSWTITFAPNSGYELTFPIVLSTATTTLTLDITGTNDVGFHADISGPGNRVITGANNFFGAKDHVPMTYTGTTTIQASAWLGEEISLLGPVVVDGGGHLFGATGAIFGGPIVIKNGGRLELATDDEPVTNAPLHIARGGIVEWDWLLQDGTSLDAKAPVTIDPAALFEAPNAWSAVGVTYTVIRNESGQGYGAHFTNLPEGGEFESGGGRIYRASYVGGTGHDFTLTGIAAYDTTATLTVDPASSDDPGSRETLTAKVRTPKTTGAAQGTVTFLDGSTVLGHALLANGVATLSVVLPTGAHSLSATFSGAGYAASRAPSVAYEVSAAVTPQVPQTGATAPSTPTPGLLIGCGALLMLGCRRRKIGRLGG